MNVILQNRNSRNADKFGAQIYKFGNGEVNKYKPWQLMFSDYATAVDTRQERTLSMMDDERDNFISETLIPENLEKLLELDLIL